MGRQPPYPEQLARIPEGPTTREEREAWVNARNTFRIAWQKEQRTRTDICQYKRD